MEIQKNMAEVFRAIKVRRNLSFAEFAEELEISRSALQDYMEGKGNPRADTIEHLANKLDVDPLVFFTGQFDASQLKIIMLLLDTLQELSSLTPEQRQRFAALFCEMINLWSDEHESSDEEPIKISPPYEGE